MSGKFGVKTNLSWLAKQINHQVSFVSVFMLYPTHKMLIICSDGKE